MYVPFIHVFCNIDEFIRYYRATFPEASITRKLHIFEDHVVLFIRQCRVGLGVMGEQGAESIHNRFNVLERTYSNMPNKVNRLKCGGRPLPPGFPSKHRQAATCCEES